MLIVALYYRSLLSGIHHTYQVRVLLAVEMQAGSGCSIPNHTVLYCTDSYRSVETSHQVIFSITGQTQSLYQLAESTVKYLWCNTIIVKLTAKENNFVP